MKPSGWKSYHCWSSAASTQCLKFWYRHQEMFGQLQMFVSYTNCLLTLCLAASKVPSPKNNMDFAKTDVLKNIWFWLQKILCLTTPRYWVRPLAYQFGPFKSFWPGWLASVVDSIGNTGRFATLDLDFIIALWQPAWTGNHRHCREPWIRHSPWSETRVRAEPQAVLLSVGMSSQ